MSGQLLLVPSGAPRRRTPTSCCTSHRRPARPRTCGSSTPARSARCSCSTPTTLAVEVPESPALGLDPLSTTRSPAPWLPRCCGRTTRKLKPLLIDQHVIAGIGNIYATRSCTPPACAPTAWPASLPTPGDPPPAPRPWSTILNEAIKRRRLDAVRQQYVDLHGRARRATRTHHASTAASGRRCRDVRPRARSAASRTAAARRTSVAVLPSDWADGEPGYPAQGRVGPKPVASASPCS